MKALLVFIRIACCVPAGLTALLSHHAMLCGIFGNPPGEGNLEIAAATGIGLVCLYYLTSTMRLIRRIIKSPR